MARFVFKLETVLRQRKHAEREKQRELAARQNVLTQAQQELRELDEYVRATTNDLRENRLIGKIDLSFLAAHRRFMLASQRKAVMIAQKIASAQNAFDEAQALLAQAAMQRKIIEKLREKQLERWQAGEHRREMNAQDELNVQLGFEMVSTEESS